MSVTVDRVHQLRMDHLALANKVRVGCAEFKRDIRTGRKSAREAILDPPAFLGKMSTVELLISFPRVGRVKALSVMNAAGVPQARRVGDLTERQRTALVEALSERGWVS